MPTDHQSLTPVQKKALEDLDRFLESSPEDLINLALVKEAQVGNIEVLDKERRRHYASEILERMGLLDSPIPEDEPSAFADELSRRASRLATWLA